MSAMAKLTCPLALACALACLPGLSRAQDAAPATQSLERLTKLYEVAQRAVGGEHIMLTATLYVGELQPERAVLEGGAAGLITLPLFGAGSGHGADWYPVLATEDSSDAFRRFQAEIERYTGLVEAVAQADQEQAFRALVEAARLLAREIDDADPHPWQAA